MTTKTYRGSSLEELLPKIREELGEDAIVTRQREGILGGFAGFFGKRCVEVEACAAAWAADLVRPSVPADVASQAYTQPDETELVAAVADNPLIRELIDQSTPFAEQLTDTMLRQELIERETVTPEDVVQPVRPAAAATTDPMPRPPAPPRPAPHQAPKAAAPRRRSEAELLVAGARDALLRSGLSTPIVDDVIDEVVTFVRPFAPEEPLTTQIRRALAARIRVEHIWDGHGRTLVLVGASGCGRTSTAARLCRALTGGPFAPAALTLGSEEDAARLGSLLGDGIEFAGAAETSAEATRLVQRYGGLGRLFIVDTPPVSPADPDGLARVAGLVRAVSPDEVHVVVSATTAGAATAALLDALRPMLWADRLILTRLDEAAEIGGPVGIALEHGLPISYIASGRDPDRGLRPADPVELARLLLP